MGVVYLAEQRGPIERRVALKLIAEELTTPEVLARFEVERQALARMQHPNIAAVHDAGTSEDGRPYFAMEYIAGCSITRFADEAALGIRERIALFEQVLDAIEHAHQKGIIHRDIKPANVLVDASGDSPRVKIIDFGVAKAIDARLTSKTLDTLSGRLVGTLEYMSPEQVRGDRTVDDTRTDLYSAALLLYELLVGGLPFDGERYRTSNLAQIHHLICEEDPPLASVRSLELCQRDPAIAARRGRSPEGLARALRGDLDTILAKGLEKAQVRRYRSASEFRDDLRNHLADLPISASRPSAAIRARKFIRRHRIGVAAAASITLALVLGLVLAAVGLREAARGRRAAETALDRVAAEADRAEAMYEFLQETLLSAGPETTQGRDDAVLREVLDRAAARAGVRLRAHPTGEVAIRSTIAHTYLALGRYEEAERELELAESRLDSIEEPSPALLAQLALVRGRAATEQGRFGPAREHFERALAEAERIPESDPSHRTLPARIRKDLGWLLLQEEDFAGAEEAARQALAVFEDPEELPEYRLEARNLLALVLKYSERYEEAERLYRRSIEEAKQLGENHPFLGQLENNLGMLLLYTDRTEEAETVLQSALRRREATFDPDHPAIAETCNNLAVAERMLGKPKEAVPLFERARSILETHVDPMHPNLASLSFNIAELHEEGGELPGAVREYRRAAAIDEANYGVSHGYVARDRFQLARALFHAGEVEEAATAAARAVESYRTASQTPQWQLARALSLRAAVLRRLGRWEPAEAALLEAYRLSAADLGADDDRTRGLRKRLHELYEAWGRPEEAKRWE